MIPTLRPYQDRGLDEVRIEARRGHSTVLFVLPTGGGKSVFVSAAIKNHMGKTSAEGVVVVVHRLDLVEQMQAHLAKMFTVDEVGVIVPGAAPSPHAPVQISTIQTLVARGLTPRASLIVLDEAHHYVADTWRTFRAKYPKAFTLGLTATPERQDGRALGDIFDGLVVGAHYSELLEGGWLVPCVAFAPQDGQLTSGIALDPVEAYHRHAPGERGFAFFARVAEARLQADRFTAAGIPADVIHAKTPKDERRAILDRFKRGALKMLCNVSVLTEGVDVPDASVCILGSKCEHQGGYLQKAGRVLRPADGKAEAKLIDLTGAVYQHGLPTDDRIYSLEGDAITRKLNRVPALSTCQLCGAVYPAARKCVRCGFVPDYTAPPVHIHNVNLKAVYAGKLTPKGAKQEEFTRLLSVARERNFTLAWVKDEYQTLFDEEPPFRALPREEKSFWFRRMKDLARAKGYAPGWVSHRYRAAFGVWPRGMEA